MDVLHVRGQVTRVVFHSWFEEHIEIHNLYVCTIGYVCIYI